MCHGTNGLPGFPCSTPPPHWASQLFDCAKLFDWCNDETLTRSATGQPSSNQSYQYGFAPARTNSCIHSGGMPSPTCGLSINMTSILSNLGLAVLRYSSCLRKTLARRSSAANSFSRLCRSASSCSLTILNPKAPKGRVRHSPTSLRRKPVNSLNNLSLTCKIHRLALQAQGSVACAWEPSERNANAFRYGGCVSRM